MIKTLLLDIFLWTLGYFAIIAGNFYLANILSFLIFALFTIILVVFIVVKLYNWAEDKADLDLDEKLKIDLALAKMQRLSLNPFKKWYVMITSAAEVAILISFGWTFCAIAWMLMTFMVMNLRSGK